MFIGEKFSLTDILLRYGIKNFLKFSCRLPYQLLTNIDVFDINVNMQLSENIKLENQKIIYAITEELIEHQAIPSKGTLWGCNPFSNDYSFFITNIDIIVEIDEKYDEIIDLIFKKVRNVELTTIFQSALEIFASKYNEAMSGKDIFNPIARECGANICGYYKRNKMNGKYESKNFILIANYDDAIPNDREVENLKDIINEPYKTWKYFYNKAIYSFFKSKNLDCVLYGAISLESYLNYLIERNNLEKKFDVFKEEKEKDGKVIGFFATTKFLKNENIISNKIEAEINSVYGKISKYRNDIVHGKIQTPLLGREIALQTQNGLQKIYNKIEKNNNSIKVSETFETIAIKVEKEKNFLLEHNKLNNLENINSFINNNQFKEVCLLLRGKHFMEVGDYKKAISDYSECINSEYQLETSLHNRANAYIKSGEFEKAINDMDTLESLLGEKKIECIYINRGIALFYMKNYEEAMKQFDYAIKLNNSIIAYRFKAMIFLELNELEDATKQINLAISKEPSFENYILKIQILLQNEEIIEAEECLNKITSNGNFSNEIDNHIIAKFYNIIGVYYYNIKKEYDHSIELFSKAINYNKEEKEYYKNRSLAYKIIGDNINYIADISKIKNLD